ncbi:MAG: hypothetical protein EOS23_23945 [Mesorhizobium sp.]|nr:MAG: hypothetical protein EOS23_23945 [Mesorhizobium sp.]
MDYFDSRSLTHSDGYYHRFLLVGVYQWGIFVKEDYRIDVQPAPGGYQPVQHVISITFENGAFVVQTPNLNVFVGDHVLWHSASPDAGVPAMSIVGDNNAGDRFDSQHLETEDAFSHLFQYAGSYTYLVSEGGGGSQTGVITVTSPNPGRGQSYIVMLTSGQAPNPTPRAIYVGDSILWDVDTGGDVIIYGV